MLLLYHLRLSMPVMRSSGYARTTLGDVVVVSSVSVEVAWNEERTYCHAIVIKVLVVLRGFICISSSAIARLTFVGKVRITLMRIW
jgi:hypothetical protein